MIDDYIEGARLLNNATIRLQHKQVYDLMRHAYRLVFVGNGGSMSCCGHMAHDFLKVGKRKTLAPESASLITCLANDCKTNMFVEWYKVQQYTGDLVFIVSSSGKSENLINLARYINNCTMHPIVTITGFAADNPLGQMGNINVHIPTQSFGVHELMSECFLHSLLDNLVKETQ